MPPNLSQSTNVASRGSVSARYQRGSVSAACVPSPTTEHTGDSASSVCTPAEHTGLTRGLRLAAAGVEHSSEALGVGSLRQTARPAFPCLGYPRARRECRTHGRRGYSANAEDDL
eukprot:scaffold1727_cov61-Phaeocystis_antarctica.AAC.5